MSNIDLARSTNGTVMDLISSQSGINHDGFLYSSDSNIATSIKIQNEKDSVERVKSPSLNSSALQSDIETSPHPVGPAGGSWQWVVLFTSFLAHMIFDGIGFSFGVLFVDFIKYFGESKAKTSWAGSALMNTAPLISPIASYLTNRYGCRKVCIAGGLICTGSFIVSTFATSVEMLLITFAITGFGMSLCGMTFTVSIAFYFERKRSFAMGIANCGSGFGTFAFPPLIAYFIEQYSWQGTLLILSGFYLNVIVFGAVMRGLHPNTLHEKASHNPTASEPKICPPDKRQYSSLVLLPTYLNASSSSEHVDGNSRKDDSHVCPLFQQHSCSLNFDDGRKLNSQTSGKEWPINVQLLHCAKKKTMGKFSNSIVVSRRPNAFNDSSFTKCDSRCRKSADNLHRRSFTVATDKLNREDHRFLATSCPNISHDKTATVKTSTFMANLKQVILEVCDLSPMKNIPYALFCLANLVMAAFMDLPYIYIPDLAHNLGYDEESASFLISVLGAVNVVGIIFIGYIGDKSWISNSLLHSILLIAGGVLMGIVPWTSSYYGLGIICGLYGFTNSVTFTLTAIVVVDLISLDGFTEAFGIILFIQGVASLCGPPFAGMLFDITGNYDATFFTIGIGIITAGVLMFPYGKTLFCIKRPNVASVRQGRESVKEAFSTAQVKLTDLPDLEDNDVDISSGVFPDSCIRSPKELHTFQCGEEEQYVPLISESCDIAKAVCDKLDAAGISKHDT